MIVTTRNLREPAASATLERQVSRLFNEALGGFDGQSRDDIGAAWVPPVDIFEEPEAIKILAEVPGVKPEDVQIAVEDNRLTIRGSKEQVAEQKAERVHRYERVYGTFERSFILPATVDSSKIKATYDSGVLTVTLPKVEKAKPRQIQVEVAKA